MYVGSQTADTATEAAISLAAELARMFKTYELIVVDDDCGSDKADRFVKALAGHPCSIVRMGITQGLEAAMNAGIDAAVGDYIFEIDDVSATDATFIPNAYAAAMDGADIVNGVPTSGSSFRGRLFYKLFNHFSGFPSKLASNPCRLVSRRAINRVRTMSSYSPYRKASYAASGLKVVEVPVEGRTSRQTGASVAITSLALYTSAFYRMAFWLAAIMAIISLAELIYVIVIAISGIAVTGWVTTMLVMTVGFMAVFVLMAFALKYLDLLVQTTFEKQGYLTDGIERPNE